MLLQPPTPVPMTPAATQTALSPQLDTSAVAEWRREAVVELQGQSLGSLESWDSVRTVALHEEERLHDQDRQRAVGVGGLTRWWFAAQGWLLAIGVGVLSSLTGTLIEVGVNHLAAVRFGFCKPKPFVSWRQCPEGGWVFWTGVGGFVVSVGTGTAMAVASALLVHLVAPAASGSGIPEVKTILNGFVMPEVVSFRTLCIKVPGLVLSVAAGMALGKEGPLVHVAVCWAQLLSGMFPQFQNEGKRRELFSAAAAAGVSTAFGAPLGGVLFSLEEVSSHFPSRTLLRAFTAAVTAAVTLTLINANNLKGLTLFSVEYRTACHPLEYIGFALLGVVGGLLGALFNVANVRWSRIRAHPNFRKRLHKVSEVALIAFVTLVTSWPIVFTQPLSADAIHAMFENCALHTGNSAMRRHLGLCTSEGGFAEPTKGLMGALAFSAAMRLFQTTLTFGTACPAGLFVPSLFTGACLGRCMGVAMQSANRGHRLFDRDVEPGVYSMVGAAAMLGGVCRVTISLVAIMLELTGGMTYIVPFMIAVLVAKMVGDLLSDGIYDLYIVLRGYPFLQEELSVTFTERCCDVMETVMTKLDVSSRPSAAELRALVSLHSFRGFPVVNGDHFVGYIKRRSLEELLQCVLERQGEESCVGLDEVLPFTDCTVMRMVPDASLTQVHKVFKQLGCKCIFLVGSRGRGTPDILQGMLTKKNFLRFLKSGRVGHMANHPSTVLSGIPALGHLTAAGFLGRMLPRPRLPRFPGTAEEDESLSTFGSQPGTAPVSPETNGYWSPSR